MFDILLERRLRGVAGLRQTMLYGKSQLNIGDSIAAGNTVPRTNCLLRVERDTLVRTTNIKRTSIPSVGLLAFALLIIAALSFPAIAKDPDYYHQAATWHETMLVSRNNIAKQILKATKELNNSGVELGPWYHAGPFPSEHPEAYAIAFGPEKNTDLNCTHTSRPGSDCRQLPIQSHNGPQSNETTDLSRK
jgi:hypothetical protein